MMPFIHTVNIIFWTTVSNRTFLVPNSIFMHCKTALLQSYKPSDHSPYLSGHDNFSSLFLDSIQSYLLESLPVSGLYDTDIENLVLGRSSINLPYLDKKPDRSTIKSIGTSGIAIAIISLWYVTVRDNVITIA